MVTSMGRRGVNRRVIYRDPVRPVTVAGMAASGHAVAGWSSLAMDARNGGAGARQSTTEDATRSGYPAERRPVARPRASRWDKLVARLAAGSEPCDAVRAADEHLQQAIDRYKAIRPNGAAGFERALDEILKGRP